MSFFDRLKKIFSRKIDQKELPSPQISSNENDRNLKKTFVEELKNVENPFSKLLDPENLKTIDIDKDAIQIFKQAIKNIEKYFIENNLLNVKDFDCFFKEWCTGKVHHSYLCE